MSKCVYEIVTNRIIELLEEGTVPWQRPWKSTEGAKNLVSGKPYRGINQFLLDCSPYESDYYLTFKQAKDKGGHVRRGEKSSLVIFWKWLNSVSDADESEGGSKLIKIPLLRYYQVFNLDQIDGIDPPAEEEVINPFTPIEQAEQIIVGMPQRPNITYRGSRAYYSPHLDYIQLPPKEAFTSPDHYYTTAFHELSHATGHENRVGRKGITETSYFGSHSYSQEELCAELSASMLCGVAGIETTIENSAAYIQSWLKVLKKDRKILIHAAAQAQKSADFILRREPTLDQ